MRSLIVVDGTWWQATKVLALNPRLTAVRRIVVTPRAPGNYRIRKEPRPECLATVEAVASALASLEGEPARFDEMLRAFTFMVDRQIEHQARSKAPRRRRAQEGLGRPPSLDLRDLCARHLGRRPGGISNGAQALRAAEPMPRGHGRTGRNVGWIEVVLGRLLERIGMLGT